VKYTFRKSFRLAINSLVSFSIVPLRLATYLGLFSALMALLMAMLVLYWRLFQVNSPITGLATIVIAILFLGSVQLICIGILGEYIGRIYDEVKGRPLYTLAEVAGFETARWWLKNWKENYCWSNVVNHPGRSGLGVRWGKSKKLYP